MTVRRPFLVVLLLFVLLPAAFLIALIIVGALAAYQLGGRGGRVYRSAYVDDSSGAKSIIGEWLEAYESDPYKPVTCSDNDDDDPALSSDGRRLAFASNRSGDWEIYLLRAAGQCILTKASDASIVQLTDAPGVDRNPAWSPDGKSLAFESQRTGYRRSSSWIATGRINDS